MREGNSSDTNFDCIIETLITDYPDDWLLTVELLEFATKTKNEAYKAMASSYLEEIKKHNPEIVHLIEQGKNLNQVF